MTISKSDPGPSASLPFTHTHDTPFGRSGKIHQRISRFQHQEHICNRQNNLITIYYIYWRVETFQSAYKTYAKATETNVSISGISCYILLDIKCL